MTLAAIVLAGGRSSRFGRDKLAEAIDGRPMLAACDRCRAARSSTEILVVVAPDMSPGIPNDALLVHDDQAFEGPLAGVAAGLDATDADIVVIVGGDMPCRACRARTSGCARSTTTDADACRPR